MQSKTAVLISSQCPNAAWQWTHQWQLRVSNQCSDPNLVGDKVMPDTHSYSYLGWWGSVDGGWVATLAQYSDSKLFFYNNSIKEMKCTGCPQFFQVTLFMQCVFWYTAVFPWLHAPSCTGLPLLKKHEEQLYHVSINTGLKSLHWWGLVHFISQ